ncbi:MAG: ABC transporter substrate-binding protein [Chloroflexi bacterium]|nr:ABC transporter substrate-binding protein [Chloroflexota bacterium]
MNRPIFPRVSRRRLLALTGGGLLLAACGAPAAPKPAEPTKPAAAAPTTAPAAAPTTAPAAAPTTAAAAKPTMAAPVAAATTAPASVKPTGGPAGEIIIARGGNLRGVDPHAVVGLYEGELLSHIYEPMVRFKPATLEPIGVLAEKWEQSPDGKTWTFYLKKGIKFQNGEEVTADAVRKTYERVFTQTEGNAFNQIKGKMELSGLVVKDPYTVQITMVNPVPSLALVPPAFASVISPKAMQADPEKFWEKPGAGSGPWQLVSWSRDHLEADAWPEYRDKSVNLIKKLKYRVILEDATKLAALKTGEAHAIDQVPIEQVAAMEKDPNFRILRAKTTDAMHLNLNTQKAPFDNAKAREAVMYAMDREALVKTILGGAAEVISQPAPVGFLGHNPDLKPYPYDPAKSLALLKEAGIQTPVKVTLIQPNAWFPKVIEVPQAIAAMMREAGFDVTVQPLEGGAFTEARRGSKYDLAFMQLGFGSDPDASVYTGRILNDYWGTGYEKLPEAKPVLDKIVAARGELDPKKRNQLYQEIEAALYKSGPRVILYRNTYIWGVLPKVKNLTVWESTYEIKGTSLE